MKVLLAAWTGALIGLLLGAAALGDREPVQIVLERSINCANAYSKDAYLGVARDFCQADTWPFKLGQHE